MEAREKAVELFGKMKGFRVKHSHSRKCALITADECLNLMLNEYSESTEAVQFWKQVKIELENIK